MGYDAYITRYHRTNKPNTIIIRNDSDINKVINTVIENQDNFEYEDIETVKDRIKHDSCKYAKKQYTYINDIPGSVVVEFTASDSDIKKVAEIISDFVQN